MLILRHQFETYMDLGTSGSPDFNLIGEGFTSLSESKNPKEYTRKYVNKTVEQSDVIGFSPSIAYNCDAISDDPVVAEIIDITDGEAKGDDTHRDIVTVNLWQPGGTEGTYVACKRNYSVIPSNKGDGTDALVYTGTFKAVGDKVTGVFAPATKTFTPDE